MQPIAAEIVESVRKIQDERNALLDLLRRVEARSILPDDLAAEIRARLN